MKSNNSNNTTKPAIKLNIDPIKKTSATPKTSTSTASPTIKKPAQETKVKLTFRIIEKFLFKWSHFKLNKETNLLDIDNDFSDFVSHPAAPDTTTTKTTPKSTKKIDDLVSFDDFG